jgi:hypothetical protein
MLDGWGIPRADSRYKSCVWLYAYNQTWSCARTGAGRGPDGAQRTVTLHNQSATLQDIAAAGQVGRHRDPSHKLTRDRLTAFRNDTEQARAIDDPTWRTTLVTIKGALTVVRQSARNASVVW